MSNLAASRICTLVMKSFGASPVAAKIWRRKVCSPSDRLDAISASMPAGRHRGNNQAYHIAHKLIVGWTTWKMRMGFMGKPLVADVVVFFLHWTDILLQFLAAKV